MALYLIFLTEPDGDLGIERIESLEDYQRVREHHMLSSSDAVIMQGAIVKNMGRNVRKQDLEHMLMADAMGATIL